MSTIEIPSFNIILPRPRGIVLDPLPSGHGMKVHGHVFAVLRNRATGEIRDVIDSSNIVTTDGDWFYAARAVNGQPADNLFTSGVDLTFDGVMELYTGVTASPIKAGNRSSLTGGTAVEVTTGVTTKAMAVGYPKVNDDDVNNPGTTDETVVTYKVSYLTSEANATGIDDVIITNPSPGASEKILMWTELGAFNKTSADSLDVYINHTMN